MPIEVETSINVDANELINQISSLISSYSNRAEFVKALADEFNTKYRVNVVVLNLGWDHDLDIYERKFFVKADKAGCTFGIYGFEYGSLFRRGDGGYINWATCGQFLRHNEFVTYHRGDLGDQLQSHGDLRSFFIMRSLSNRFLLIMQNDGNLVLYDSHYPNPWGEGAIWATNTYGRGQPPYRMSMQGDGNLVVYDRLNRPIWASNTFNKGVAPYRLRLQDDGNLVIYDARRRATWASNTCR